MADTLREVCNEKRAVVTTQRGKAKVVLQDIASYQQTEESLVLLTARLVSTNNIQKEQYKPALQIFKEVRTLIKSSTSGKRDS